MEFPPDFPPESRAAVREIASREDADSIRESPQRMNHGLWQNLEALR